MPNECSVRFLWRLKGGVFAWLAAECGLSEVNRTLQREVRVPFPFTWRDGWRGEVATGAVFGAVRCPMIRNKIEKLT